MAGSIERMPWVFRPLSVFAVPEDEGEDEEEDDGEDEGCGEEDRPLGPREFA